MKHNRCPVCGRGQLETIRTSNLFHLFGIKEPVQIEHHIMRCTKCGEEMLNNSQSQEIDAAVEAAQIKARLTT